MSWAETGLHWVLPSPNMPTPDTALVYPGGCLIEGTNLSEGRGTTRPFELWGAPWLDPDPLAEPAPWTRGGPAPPLRLPADVPQARRADLLRRPAPRRRPATFAPVWFYTAMLAAARRQRPDRFAWRREPYEFVVDPIAIDLLYGSDRERLLIESEPDARTTSTTSGPSGRSRRPSSATGGPRSCSTTDRSRRRPDSSGPFRPDRRYHPHRRRSPIPRPGEIRAWTPHRSPAPAGPSPDRERLRPALELVDGRRAARARTLAPPGQRPRLAERPDLRGDRGDRSWLSHDVGGRRAGWSRSTRSIGPGRAWVEALAACLVLSAS